MNEDSARGYVDRCLSGDDPYRNSSCRESAVEKSEKGPSESVLVGRLDANIS